MITEQDLKDYVGREGTNKLIALMVDLINALEFDEYVETNYYTRCCVRVDIAFAIDHYDFLGWL